MRHGWVNRGDLKDPATLNDVNDALRRTKSFFRHHLFKKEFPTAPSHVSIGGGFGDDDDDDNDDKKSK